MYPLLILTSDITSPQAPKACSGSRVLASSTRQSFFCQDIKKQSKEPGGLRETFEEDEEKKCHPSLPQQQATRGGSLVTNTTQARLSVSGKISANP